MSILVYIYIAVSSLLLFYLVFPFLTIFFSLFIKEKIKDEKTEEIITLISQNPKVLEEKDENNSSGFMLIAYSNNSLVFKKAISLKQIFSFHEAILSGKSDLVKSFVKKEKNRVNEYSISFVF